VSSKTRFQVITPTAGANGNSDPIAFPGDDYSRIEVTGIYNSNKITYHMKGIYPDVTINRTHRGITMGEDEIFDAAKAILSIK
jgi:C-terminal processing protease CtpA/Prc